MDITTNQDDGVVEITLVGDDGSEETFEHVLTFMYDNERYMALIPSGLANEDEAELIFMHIEPRKLDGEDAYAVVDNEVLQEELFQVFCDLIDEMESDSDAEENEISISDDIEAEEPFTDDDADDEDDADKNVHNGNETRGE